MKPEINKICASFFKKTGLTYYNFVRIYNDNSRISLCTNKKWHDYFLKQDKKHINLETTEDGASLKVVWDCLSNMRNNKLIIDAREMFNIDHGCTLIKNFEGYIEYHYFATETGNDQVNMMYINEDAELHRFITYFKQEAAPLISGSKKLEFENTKFWQGKDRQKIYEKEKQRVYLEGKYSGIYLTPREAQVFKATSEGLTSKQTAAQLKIGVGTIDKYIASLKLKLRCSRKCFSRVSKESGFSSLSAVI